MDAETGDGRQAHRFAGEGHVGRLDWRLSAAREEVVGGFDAVGGGLRGGLDLWRLSLGENLGHVLMGMEGHVGKLSLIYVSCDDFSLQMNINERISIFIVLRLSNILIITQSIYQRHPSPTSSD